MSSPRDIKTYRVLQTPVTALPFEEQILLMTEWAKHRSSKFVSVANVHMLMEAHWKPKFAEALTGADLVTPDGMPLVWMLRAMGAADQDRVAGMDIFLQLCQMASLKKIGVFLLGANDQVLGNMEKRLKIEFPELNLVGTEPLPYRKLTAREDQAIMQTINDSGAGFLFVCLGCPKQELWIAQHKDQINAVMIGLGAVFPTYAGVQKRAPAWMRELGLEWLYRFTQEPRRLGPRYGKTIPPFVYLALQQLLSLTWQRAWQRQKL
ncbi:MAG: WecB/TagA/CpsF family glycosyltransferase [Cyanobacteria bacterium]|jgi:N-acetylglucosaminyldiphosphoundecaprenol N-acetyl-beta-D-mannosaminyltransferase|nr:WecB/TagA/CpsF family glycosyltransferase [Cyanobacteria bacterium GSL.Bin21]